MTVWPFLGAWLAVVLAAIASEWWHEHRQAAALARSDRQWERLLVMQAGLTTKALDHAVFGGTPRDAEITTRGEDAHDRLEREVSEQTITAGMNALREGYRGVGVEVSDDDLRAEVIAMASGLPPVS